MAPVSIRTNNPGAINTASWVREYPGYVGATVTTPGNATVSFATPEHGVAAWWELLARYRDSGVTTLRGVIYRYCGAGREGEAADYTSFIMKATGLAGSTTLVLDNDRVMLAVAKAFFRYEAGQPTPLKDSQIIAGFAMGRAARAQGASNPTPRYPGDPLRLHGLLRTLWGLLAAFLSSRASGAPRK